MNAGVDQNGLAAVDEVGIDRADCKGSRQHQFQDSGAGSRHLVFRGQPFLQGVERNLHRLPQVLKRFAAHRKAHKSFGDFVAPTGASFG
jgi:hypothetical protein